MFGLYSMMLERIMYDELMSLLRCLTSTNAFAGRIPVFFDS